MRIKTALGVSLLLFVAAFLSGEPPVRLAAIPETPRPGEPVTLGLAAVPTGPFRAVLLDRRGQRLSAAAFFDLGAAAADGQAVQAAILAIPSTAGSGPARILAERNGNRIAEVPITIAGRDFASEEIPLDQGNTALRTQPDPQKTAESARLWAIISRTGTEILAPAAFVSPVASNRRTSFFGDRRIYRYANGSAETAIHAGVDFGVPRGTAVRACAPGRVVLAGQRIVTGNSVIIEHLPGVYSLYYHLDSVEVREGALVDAGTLLGASGSTGLSTGPHLHWEIRVAGENADPDAFTARAVLDKAAILGKLDN
ncbi:MAG: M23 family metallopeptidase [Spirochaetaceae bacterium]|jgi:murein DD-endopeptidase MepM/ murein hydrolase activator NlpD|nr:M23 family metallopeptidase [Spirochaetaceae bacterium]